MIYTKIVFIQQLTKEQSNFLNKYRNNIKKIKMSETNNQDISKEIYKAHNNYYKKSVANNLLIIEYQTIKLLKEYMRKNELYLVNFADQIMIITNKNDTTLNEIYHRLKIQNIKIDPNSFDFNKLLVFRVWSNVIGLLNKLNFTIESTLSTKCELLQYIKTDEKFLTEIVYLYHIRSEVENLLEKNIVTSNQDLSQISCALLKHITYKIQDIVDDQEIIKDLISINTNFTDRLNDDIIENIEQHIIRL